VTPLQAGVVRAFAYWTIFVWVNRIWNIFQDPKHDFAFKAVHSGLAAVSILLAVAALLVVRSVRRRARAVAQTR
jgi:hypothetical protein